MTLILTLGIVNTWTYSTIKVHLCGIFISNPYYKQLNTLEEWENFMLLMYGKIGELLVCKICLSHWVSLIISILGLYIIGEFVWWFPLYCFFSIPFFVSKFV